MNGNDIEGSDRRDRHLNPPRESPLGREPEMEAHNVVPSTTPENLHRDHPGVGTRPESESMRGKRKQNVAITALKWVTLLPTAVVVFFAASAFSDFLMQDYYPQTIADMKNNPGFGGHFIIGPIYLFTKRFTACAAACAVTVWLAPAHKRIVFGAFIGLLISWTLFAAVLILSADSAAVIITWETVASGLVEVFALFLGAISGGNWMIQKDGG